MGYGLDDKNEKRTSSREVFEMIYQAVEKPEIFVIWILEVQCTFNELVTSIASTL
jgi:hypothetical protein